MPEDPEPRGRFYQFIHSAAMSFPWLPILRIHRHVPPPEGQDPPPLADLHPGDIVEVAPTTVAADGTESATVLDSPHLEPIPDDAADEAVAGKAYVQTPERIAPPALMDAAGTAAEPVPAEPAPAVSTTEPAPVAEPQPAAATAAEPVPAGGDVPKPSPAVATMPAPTSTTSGAPVSA